MAVMSVGSPRIEIVENPGERDQHVVLDGLRAFNVAFIGDPNEVQLAAFARDEAGTTIGGMLGHIKWRWLYVGKLWLPESTRGQGLGTRIMDAVERYAWSHDCLGVYLDTFEYQALPFYQKLGYEIYGTLDGFPPGYRQFYLRKLRSTGSISP